MASGYYTDSGYYISDGVPSYENEEDRVDWDTHETLEIYGDSSALKLYDAVENVLNNDGLPRYNSLAQQYKNLIRASEILGQANPGLGTSWRNAAENCLKIENKVATELAAINRALRQYADETYTGETALKNVTDEFNDEMEVLSDLLDNI